MTRRLVVEADGGSRGNPGPAGYGALVKDADTGQLLAERAESIGRATNNVAEYGGLVAGLQAALDIDPTAEVEVRMDSKLVVEQMSGRWQVKHPDMKKLAVQAREVSRQLGRVRYTWIPRAQNSAADALANSAMDGRPVRRDAGVDPVELVDAAPAVEGGPAPAGERVARQDTAIVPRTSTTTHLLRHGRTVHTGERRFSGRNDLPLSPEGRAEAEAAAARLAGLGIEVVISSPLRRTRETAEIVAAALGLPVELDDGLVEMDFGLFEGLSGAEARAAHPEEHRRWAGDVTVAPPGGESIAAVADRVRAARQRIVAAHEGRTVLLVSHVTPIKVLLTEALGVPLDVVHRVFLEAASLCTASWTREGGSWVQLVNDTSHLR
ncbi:bifunctional RNase H/acid phosphatase [Modestobacter sp. I12A-02628]|uniref:Bifunctional RNase H/acid phosphatase n=1 Tax=Goekera deserti TaxID=2497753 RepID=A0A7K3WB51_9ACTN|nr:bifunctional RNase H/acid phosphatase [Goekera deserti]MPQ97560.1 bifunctional RNase H/acid phosphatase [Goekera deserti]NDI47836.1 bifunctional RNase H/acid phosphatase [Goekera deserti]NEL53584.1 bifunctional RNase H/acid phosphatase [Goekera deserti]